MVSIAPKTFLGKWSVGLIIFFFLLFEIFQLFIAFGQRGGDTFFSNLTLAVPISLAGISGIAAFFTGVISIIKNKEKGVLVFLSAIVGFFVLVFCFGEAFFPH